MPDIQYIVRNMPVKILCRCLRPGRWNCDRSRLLSLFKTRQILRSFSFSCHHRHDGPKESEDAMGYSATTSHYSCDCAPVINGSDVGVPGSDCGLGARPLSRHISTTGKCRVLITPGGAGSKCIRGDSVAKIGA